MPELPDYIVENSSLMAADNRETEIKLAVASAAQALADLERRGFQITRPRVFEANVIYDTQDSNLRNRGSIVRLRQAGEQVVLTYKGRAQTGKHKSREEYEVLVSDFDSAQRILEGLGFMPRFRYEKYRTELRRESSGGLVTLDETPVGCFLELEGDPSWIDATAGELGFGEKDYLTLSYGALYLEFCKVSGVEPTHMVFSDGG